MVEVLHIGTLLLKHSGKRSFDFKHYLQVVVTKVT